MRSRHAGGHGCLGLECDGMPSRETIEEKLGRGPDESDDYDDMRAETAADKF